MALVNYIDEYLTANNKVPENESSHKQVGGLLLISTLLSFLALVVLTVYLGGDFSVDKKALYLSLFSAIPMVTLFASYFYLFLFYPAHQVVPLFGLSSIWLLLFEIAFVEVSISQQALVGILILIFGAYLLDSGSLKWRIPTKLLLIMIPVSLIWAISLYMVRIASETESVATIFFYQYVGIGIIGILLTLLVKPYRKGLLQRIRLQGKNFIGFSLINESLAQISFFFIMLAVALAPLAAFVTALGGLNSIFLLILFYLFPLQKRNNISRMQWIAIILMTIGIFIIEFWK